jgi:hypothetical protein
VRLRFLLVPIVLVSCAELFDDAVQCKSDADCDRFGNAVCSAGVCVSPADAGPVPEPPEHEDAPSGDERPVTDRCARTPKTKATLGTKTDAGRSEITTPTSLDCEKDWTLDTLVVVRSTLTIEPGTTIHAARGAGLIINPGAKIVAEGKRDQPIVFTSSEASPAPGDWRGVFLLGRAPPSGEPPFEGDPDLAWGGSQADDDSGSLSFVRIEYAKSGLVFAGAGKKTKVDFVQVRKTIDRCFMFHGGTVDAKHLVCQAAGDDHFAWDWDYAGRMQFLFGQKGAAPHGATGALIDDARPVIYNVTLCGDTPPAGGYGIVLRDNGTLDMNGAIATGWFAGLDVTGSVPVPGNLRHSVLFANTTNPSYNEDLGETDPSSPAYNDDNGFNEISFFNAAERKNTTTDPKLAACLDPKNPRPWPTTSLPGATPPSDGFFDTKATFIGAFRDSSDNWLTDWTRFDDR